MALAVYHFQFPSEASARLLVHLVIQRLKVDVAVCREGSSVMVLDASGKDRRAQLLALTVDL